MTLHVGIDSGGTFTDLVVYDSEKNEIQTYKTPSTPSCINNAASAGVASPPAAKLTTGRRPVSATWRTRS